MCWSIQECLTPFRRLQKMTRTKQSEYRHAYRPKNKDLTEEYSSHLDYVTKRRILENHHFQSPFEWDESDESDSSGYDDQMENLSKKFNQKVEIVPNKCSPQSKTHVIRKIARSPVKGSTGKGVQVERCYLPPSPRRVSRSTSANPSTGPSACSYFRSYRPFVNNIPIVRRSPSQKLSTPASKCFHVHERMPPSEEEVLDGTLHPAEFTPYGSGNKARRIAGKRTFNVRADRGVSAFI